MISVTPIVIPHADLTRWQHGLFPSRGWPPHHQKPMEEVVSLIPDDHLYFTFLARADELHELVAIGWRKIRFSGRNDAILSGSLREWVDGINEHCRDDSHASVVRRFYNAVQIFLVHIGLDRLWSGRYKQTLPDDTFIFTD